MFECPSCGGNLKFDILSQKLGCEFCHEQFDPYSFENKQKDAEEQNDFEATIYTCPQCGGELLSTDNAAASFCSFCGASTVLYQRISNEHRPNFIIPFQKTKDDCKKAYSDMIKHAIFAPKDMKDPSKIDGFRGIYMPYWSYYITEKGPFSLKSEKSHRSGDYIITDHYKLTGEIDGYHKGLSYDASSSFSDNISRTIAPYDVKGMKAFTPAFFSGFYADTSDVPSGVYEEEAIQLAYEDAYDKVVSHRAYAGQNITSQRSTPSTLNTRVEGVDSSMFPVWFMSYRNGDRVAYATVNGQTGKVVADLPIVKGKYLLASLLLAIPIFFLLNTFLTLKPTTLLTFVAFLAILSCGIFTAQINAISKKENGEDDIGLLYIRNPKRMNDVRNKRLQRETKKEKTGSKNMIKALGIVFILLYGLSLGGAFLHSLIFQNTSLHFIWLIIPLLAIIIGAFGLFRIGEVPKGHRHPSGIIILLASVLLSGIIMLIHPVSDLYYYGCILVMLFAIVIMFLDAISYYNVLSTRRMPQFDKQGGDDRA